MEARPLGGLVRSMKLRSQQYSLLHNMRVVGLAALVGVTFQTAEVDAQPPLEECIDLLDSRPDRDSSSERSAVEVCQEALDSVSLSVRDRYRILDFLGVFHWRAAISMGPTTFHRSKAPDPQRIHIEAAHHYLEMAYNTGEGGTPARIQYGASLVAMGKCKEANVLWRVWLEESQATGDDLMESVSSGYLSRECRPNWR